MFRTSDYDYPLPPELIAQAPADRRDQSRLMVVERDGGRISHRCFADLVELVRPGDALVVNETRVFPARLLGRRPGGGEAEVLLLHPEPEPMVWQALVRPGAKLRAGRRIQIADGFAVEVLDVLPGGERLVRLHTDGPLADALERHGQIPLPPYIRRPSEAEDRKRYQTVYAATDGSVAAPTAGLHFTPELMARLEAGGVEVVRLLLHVGVGTFRPVEADDPGEHRMHREWYRVGEDAAARINALRGAGGAVWAVGTTTVRTLETVAGEDGRVHAGEGWTDIFIRPPYRLRAVDRLITNFHLPRSTLLMLVSALAGYELTMEAYRAAVEERYRFFSYGDAMAIV